MSRPVEPSEALGRYPRAVRFAIGKALYALAQRLSHLDAEEIAAFGVVLMGEASGWLGPDEVGRPGSLSEVDGLAATLLDRMAAAGEWERQLGDEDPA